ncbi:AbrB/MazE/SpoVT family DNA-binding domain-containing protein [Thermanaeromonas sp. C210]|uniref:AbrB/MazE/SpoVT family DNA-binding domain-containing protein n=1 Tax=Thermanaeromonas sp. C210 TaxID=2731925 RepID=UPI0035A593E7
MIAHSLTSITGYPSYQTVIPAHIRKRYGIEEGSPLAWVLTGRRNKGNSPPS